MVTDSNQDDEQKHNYSTAPSTFMQPFDTEKFRLNSENQALQKTIEVLEEQLATALENE